jgi:CubicO group peptidase (beta-lactamase class C family)
MQDMSLKGQLGPRLEAFARRVRHETGVPGLAVGVAHHGERAFAVVGTTCVEHGAPLPSAARFDLGCITKLLLAIVMLELCARGRLDLDSALGEVLYELRATVHGRTVRIAHLLSHTSGYRGTHLLDPRARPDDWQGFMEYLRHAPQLFTPGRVFSYEHTESLLLAEILRRVTGTNAMALVAERVLQPLGVAAQTRTQDGENAGRHRYDERAARFVALDRVPSAPAFWLPAFSEFTVTLADIMRIAELAMTGGVRGRPLLAPATLLALNSSVVALPPTAGGPLRELLPIAFGHGTGELRGGLRGNTGVSAGQCLGLRFDPHANAVVAVAVNAVAPHLRDIVLTAVCRDLGANVDARVDAPLALDFALLEGTYLGPGAGVAVVRRDGAGLSCELGREHRSERLHIELGVDARGALVLRSPIPQLAIGFFREPESSVVGLMVGLSAYRRVDTR